jgi:AcrR family transcriptional regulator
MPRRGLDRARVVDAAEELGADGLGGITFARLAARLGVRPPSLYNHVENRVALIRLIAIRGADDLHEAVVSAAAGLAGPDALRATGRALRAYAHAQPARYEATLTAPSPDDAELAVLATRLVEDIAAILRAWRLEDDDAIDAIRTVRSALHGFIALERAGGFAMARPVEESFERLLDVLVAGISPPRRGG